MNPHTTHLDSRAPDRGPTATNTSRPRTWHQPVSVPMTAGDVRRASRYLIAHAFRPAEAGNLTAYLHGLAPVEGGWTVDEIEGLLFVRHLVEHQRLTS